METQHSHPNHIKTYTFYLSIEVDKIVTKRRDLNYDPLKIILKLKSNSQVVYLE